MKLVACGIGPDYIRPRNAHSLHILNWLHSWRLDMNYEEYNAQRQKRHHQSLDRAIYCRFRRSTNIYLMYMLRSIYDTGWIVNTPHVKYHITLVKARTISLYFTAFSRHLALMTYYIITMSFSGQVGLDCINLS